MPRTARLTYPGGFYHIFNRSLEKKTIFKQSRDYIKLLDKLTDLIHEGDWIIYAYCLMPNHYHFLIEEKKMPISKLMGRLLTSYGVYFNKKYHRQGPLFQDRFKSKLIQKDNYFLKVSRYIHLNPVNAGLTENPENYPYSSLKEYLGNSKREIINLDKVTTLLGERKTRIKDYLEFIKEGMTLDLEEYNPFNNMKEVIGNTVFATHRKMR